MLAGVSPSAAAITCSSGSTPEGASSSCAMDARMGVAAAHGIA